MEPVFTLQWSEFVIANRLQDLLGKRNGYSVLVPTSRQEKGIDLAVLRKTRGGNNRVVTLQVKASRTYDQEPPKRASVVRCRYGTWFNRFDVPDSADFFLLFGLYASDPGRTRRVGSKWYRDVTLLFSNQEMRDFMSNCKTVKGKPDRMFGFGFDEPTAVYQTRGDQHRRRTNFSEYLLECRIGMLHKALEG
jgi:hypothetical protein